MRSLTKFIFTSRDTLACILGRRASQRRGRSQALKSLADESWLNGFRSDAPPDQAAYADLFSYFVAGFVTHRSPLGAFADYVGMGSYNGPVMDRLEGFSRLAPLIAAWLHGGRPEQLQLRQGQAVNLIELLRTGVLNGTNPYSEEYWGNIKHWGQAIVEAADIALLLWMTRTQLWDTLGAVEQKRISDWLNQVNLKGIPDNNWHLFVVQVNLVLADLSMPHNGSELDRHYQRAKSFYRGEGWFRDGESPDKPGFDYYNAWGFHYHLQWIEHISPQMDGDFIESAFRSFLADYRYILGPEGFPIIGRSACYRMAAAAPLVLAMTRHQDIISPGQARRAMDTLWQYFIRRGALHKGNVSQGYFAADPRLLENYSGPASCLWSLRSLICAFSLPDNHEFWTGKPQPLPVEIGSYRVHLTTPDWIIIGDQATNSITLHTTHGGMPPLQYQSLGNRVAEMFACKPRRPANTLAKYHRARYDTAMPYGQSPHGNCDPCR